MRFYYCSKKVYKSYAAEGLSNAKMPFEEFRATEFFQRELEATKKWVEEKPAKKSKRPDSQIAGHMELRQGPNSPHVYTGFPGVPGKYIYTAHLKYTPYTDIREWPVR